MIDVYVYLKIPTHTIRVNMGLLVGLQVILHNVHQAILNMQAEADLVLESTAVGNSTVP